MEYVELNNAPKGEMKVFKNVEDFVLWENRTRFSMELTTEEATLILAYIKARGYILCAYDQDTLSIKNLEESETLDVEELVRRVCNWNYELLLDNTITGEQHKKYLQDAELISNVLDRCGARDGYCIETPTIKEMLTILNKFPEDYRVTCCGGWNYLYLFSESKTITIDCERYLG